LPSFFALVSVVRRMFPVAIGRGAQAQLSIRLLSNYPGHVTSGIHNASNDLVSKSIFPLTRISPTRSPSEDYAVDFVIKVSQKNIEVSATIATWGSRRAPNLSLHRSIIFRKPPSIQTDLISDLDFAAVAMTLVSPAALWNLLFNLRSPAVRSAPG
jgi:hypothetical protein